MEGSPRAQARPCSLPQAFQVCLSALTSLCLSRTRRPGFAFWLRHMPSVAQAGTELDSSAKVFPSGATLAHSPKALSGTGSGKGDEEEWSGRREPVCRPACQPAGSILQWWVLPVARQGESAGALWFSSAGVWLASSLYELWILRRKG